MFVLLYRTQCVVMAIKIMFLSVHPHYTRRTKEQLYWDKQRVYLSQYTVLGSQDLGKRIRLKSYK